MIQNLTLILLFYTHQYSVPFKLKMPLYSYSESLL